MPRPICRCRPTPTFPLVLACAGVVAVLLFADRPKRGEIPAVEILSAAAGWPGR